MASVTRIVATMGATALSLLLTVTYGSSRTTAAQVLVGLPAAVQPPEALAALLPDQGTRPRPTTLQQRQRLTKALIHEPINQSLYNLWYVAQTNQRGTSPRELAAQAKLLQRLGWRNTLALRNLLLEDIAHEDLVGIMDKADALLRRQKLTAIAIAIVEAYEQFPAGQKIVLDKLLAGVPWREPLLMNGGNNRLPAFQTGQLAVLRGMVRAGTPLRRSDIESFTRALVESGRVADAAQLWTLYAGPPPAQSRLRDADFAQARKLADISGNAVPFEWTLASGIGYSTIPTGAQGLTIDWNGQSAPLFASQRLAPATTLPRTLTLQSDDLKVSASLRFTLSCGDRELAFLPVGDGPTVDGKVQRFALEAGDLTCGAPTFSILGQPDTGSQSVNLSLRRIVLR